MLVSGLFLHLVTLLLLGQHHSVHPRAELHKGFNLIPVSGVGEAMRQ